MSTLDVEDASFGVHDECAPKPPWAIVLAGGEGHRLRSLTRYVCGDDRPKQFAQLLGKRSLLRQTLDRIEIAIPIARTIVVTNARDSTYLSQEFARVERPECLVQPVDRGTAAAILWAAHVIGRREPDAVAAMFPSDHYIEGEPALMGHVLDGAAFVRRRGGIMLCGAVPTEPDTQYGWIEPGEPIGRLRAGPVYGVRRFWEKPAPEVARACLAAGGFWNTFILVAPVATLVAVGRTAVPELSARIERLSTFAGTPEEPWAIRQAFVLAPRASFSRDVLERVPAELAVTPLPGTVSWADWGTPERVIESLRRSGLRPRWLEAFGALPPRSA